MPDRNGNPRKREAVWIEGRTQPNGTIIDVSYDDQEAVVRFHTTDDLEHFPFWMLEGCWTDKFGGVWELHGCG